MPWIAAVIIAILAFLFFQCGYQYHLYRREQTMVFMMDHAFVSGYFAQAGWLAKLTGDFLTQFFYYVGIGALTISLLLAAIWLLAWNLVKQLTGNIAIISITSLGLVFWEFMRECGSTYQLGSTISLIAALALAIPIARVQGRWLNACISVALIAICYWAFGYGAFVLCALAIIFSLAHKRWLTCAIAVAAIAVIPKGSLIKASWWGVPDMEYEHKLAIDSEIYFGNWDKALKLTTKGHDSRLSTFYYYFINAMNGKLPDALTMRMPYNANALLPTMDSKKSSIELSALGNAWYYMGDLTSAEHCTIVAMISTYQYTGTKYLRRMAEINIANGDKSAAMKYLRMLSKTICHNKWAKSRIKALLTDDMPADAALNPISTDQDTLRYVNDYTKSLKHIVSQSPNNNLAYDYLQCYNLLNCDIKAFMDNLNINRILPQLYQEAILVSMAITNASHEELAKYDIPDSMVNDFIEFNRMMPMTEKNKGELWRRFGNTYWFYFQNYQNENKKDS